jgi:hypothetical protein
MLQLSVEGKNEECAQSLGKKHGKIAPQYSNVPALSRFCHKFVDGVKLPKPIAQRYHWTCNREMSHSNLDRVISMPYVFVVLLRSSNH